MRTLALAMAAALFPLQTWPQCSNSSTPSCAVYASCFAKYCPCQGDADEYFEKYGAKYCKRFMDNSRLSAHGKKWRDATLVCLQEAVVPQLDISASPSCNCKAMRKVAFESHVSCYTQPSNSICDLPLSDVKEIAATVDARDAFSIDGGKQMAAVAAICVAKAADDGRRAAWRAMQNVLKSQE